MMMGLSLCSPMDTRISSVKSFPAPASPISTVGFTCAGQPPVSMAIKSVTQRICKQANILTWSDAKCA